MKIHRLHLLILTALLSFGFQLGAEEATAPEAQGPPPPQEAGAPRPDNNARLLRHLLSMDNAQLAELRTTIERIEKMSPEEREVMRRHIDKIQKQSPDRFDNLRKRYEAIPEEKREAMRKKWQEMPKEERRAFLQSIRDLSPEERAEAFDAKGVLPSPPRKFRPGPPPDDETPPPPPVSPETTGTTEN
ncbi:DUF3106 domain-containing protein [Coraliomargarita parva]|uniref:DUF3106 domain-containing protein n=1 Tax=Coraliomargarita parva TaxID=3014050 RepID=UPI0022B387E3|nr:DUF3106 domain-containing protein [Coraliomargarita parva]